MSIVHFTCHNDSTKNRRVIDVFHLNTLPSTSMYVPVYNFENSSNNFDENLRINIILFY